MVLAQERGFVFIRGTWFWEQIVWDYRERKFNVNECNAEQQDRKGGYGGEGREDGDGQGKDKKEGKDYMV